MVRRSLQRKVARLLPLTVIVISSLSLPAGALADGPTLLKRTVIVNTRHYTSYWKDEAKEIDYHWSWLPTMSFSVAGPIEAGSQISVEYSLPNNKPWFVEDFQTIETGAGYLREFKSEPSSIDSYKKKALTTTGTFSYRIVMTNELYGTSTTLMTGRFDVEKYRPSFADKPNEFGFYVQQDWRLPIGWVWIDPSDQSLHQSIWFRGGDWNWGDVHGYLFHNGKEIGSTKKPYSSGSLTDEITSTSGGGAPQYHAFEFTWHGVLASDVEGTGRDDIFFIDKNPGDYELKVLHSGRLVRALSFSVGSDGKIVDNGIVRDNRIGGVRILVPVKITGDVDGKWNRDAWKKDALYGNPLVGFTAH